MLASIQRHPWFVTLLFFLVFGLSVWGMNTSYNQCTDDQKSGCASSPGLIAGIVILGILTILWIVNVVAPQLELHTGKVS